MKAQQLLFGALLLSAGLFSLSILFSVSLSQKYHKVVSSWDEGLPQPVLPVSPPNEDVTTKVAVQPPQKAFLRRDWTQNPPLSRFARQILQHQRNCSLPVSTFHVDNSFGLGSHLALWSQGVCNALEGHFRIRTYNPVWLWMDQTLCDQEQAQKSPLLCYFPGSECLCNENQALLDSATNMSDPRVIPNRCRLLRQSNPKKILHEPILEEFRAASTEFLFRKVSPIVIQEAERQARLIFVNVSTPEDLITVHMRWGDKFWEMDLAPEHEYVRAISDLLHEQGKSNETANIYLATEDPKAKDAFLKAVPDGWKVYYDRTVDELNDFRPVKGNRASHTAKNTRGRAGLVAMGSLLVAMEAKYFVLTTASNWSRIMNQLRTNVLDPRCGNCTRMIDLRPGIW